MWLATASWHQPAFLQKLTVSFSALTSAATPDCLHTAAPDVTWIHSLWYEMLCVFFSLGTPARCDAGGVAKSSIPPFDFEGWDHDIIFQSISDWQSRSLHRSLNQIQYKTTHCKTSPYSVKACNSNWMNETVNESKSQYRQRMVDMTIRGAACVVCPQSSWSQSISVSTRRWWTLKCIPQRWEMTSGRSSALISLRCTASEDFINTCFISGSTKGKLKHVLISRVQTVEPVQSQLFLEWKSNQYNECCRTNN